MGQTLTHGIYLPDEGERNCYSGLAANWSILDGAVGTVAEHTTALAGKAPAVHTHTKADITDFPVYGTTAGTICEGNDSRLSDARTPVAHTHTKSDVTDLFNSANTWTGEQTFSVPCKTLGKKLLTDITDLDDAYYNGEVCRFNPNTLHNPTGGYGNVLTINNAVDDPNNIYNSWITQIATTPTGTYLGTRNRSNGGAWTSWIRVLTEAYAIPTVNNTYDLGSSSYQWNNLYAKNYYYNGTIFTNKFVTTDTVQTISAEKKFTAGFSLKNTAVTSHTTAPSSETNSHFLFIDGNDRYWGGYAFYWLTDGTTETRLQHTNYSTSGGQGWWQLAFGATKDFNNVYFRPVNNATINLGDSTHKWKTLNGINPGALSLPDFSNADPIDTRNWVISTPTNNVYTPSENGWLNVVVADSTPSANEFSMYVKSTNFFASAVHKLVDIDDSKGKVGLFIPVIASITYYVVVKGNVSNGTISATFFPCLGSV